MSKLGIEEGFENEFVRVTLHNGILIAEYLIPNLNITVPIARKIVQDRLAFSNNQSYPMLGDVTRGIKLDNEAKAFFNSEESVRGINAGAFLISSRIERFIGNTWFKIAKPPIPFRLFTHKEQAIGWLQNFRYLN